MERKLSLTSDASLNNDEDVLVSRSAQSFRTDGASDEKGVQNARLVRETNWRWLMLFFACSF